MPGDDLSNVVENREDYSSQSSIWRTFIRLNSRILWVTMVKIMHQRDGRDLHIIRANRGSSFFEISPYAPECVCCGFIERQAGKADKKGILYGTRTLRVWLRAEPAFRPLSPC
jgi:hypothetical protein